jgi:hypothetical protein
MVHGQGRPKDTRKQLLEGYLRQIVSALQDILKEPATPLVLAAVDYYHPIFRSLYGSSKLVTDGVVGSPDSMSGEELHTRAWHVARAYFEDELQRAIDHRVAGVSSAETSEDLGTIVRAAHEGRIDTVLAAADREIWGTYEPSDDRLEIRAVQRPGDVDLVNLVVAKALCHGGDAFVRCQDEWPCGAVEGSLRVLLRW